jgi:DNA-binding CsgD family transcriptional regulator
MLIEREFPLDELLAAARLAADGKGLVVLVSGEAGVGKTALLRGFAARADGLSVHWGGSDPLFTPCPLGPLRDMVAGIDERVAELVEDRATPDSIFPALVSALQQGRAGRVLIFEDVHWADNATLDLIRYLGRRIAFLPCVLILSYRPEETGVGHSLSRVLGDLPASSVRRLKLQPLSLDGIIQLATETGQDATELFAVTGGNPFFATELIANLKAGPDGIPASVRDAVWARLERLEVAELSLLEAISIAPSGAEDWLAKALLLGDAGPAIASCVARGLLYVDKEERYRFRHELARQATLERLNSNTQKILHQRAFEVLAQRPSFPLACLVHHAAGAKNSEQVLSLAPMAAAEASKLGSHKEAAAHLLTALQHSDDAPLELVAQLNEDWAYEAGLALEIADTVIAASQKAIELWKALGRQDKVARNMRRMSRLYWLRGEGALAVRFADEAVEALANFPTSDELAMALGVRAQLYMFDDRFSDAIELSEKALVLAEAAGDIETKAHALNNIGSSLLYSGDVRGKPYFDQSLALTLENGLHEQSLRVYVNYAEYAVFGHEFELAEHILEQGIAFCTRHDLDFGIYYVLGRQAQLRLEQGRFREAEMIASGVLAVEHLTLVAKLPARIVHAKTRMRQGAHDVNQLLKVAMDDALKTEEQQNIVPARFAMIEAAWLASDLKTAHHELRVLAAGRLDGLAPWDMGEYAVWWKRCGMSEPFPRPVARMVPQRQDELDGNFDRASKIWRALGLPYESALALMATAEGAARAVPLLEELGALPAAKLAREKAISSGVKLSMFKPKRGPYGAARAHPLGLSGREIQVLELIDQGLGNPEIAKRLFRSQRTIEHHVSSIFRKLNAESRIDVILRLRNEPWLMRKVV